MLQQADDVRKNPARARMLAIGAAAVFGGTLLGVAPASAAPAQPQAPHQATVAQQVAARTANQAVAWYRNRQGSTAYEGYCEKAARLAWARRTHHPSAIAHWRSSDGKRHTTGRPPRGAFVFWNISSYGHVGISDGNGGFWATDVAGAIGHRSSIHYFSHYLGWKYGNSN